MKKTMVIPWLNKAFNKAKYACIKRYKKAMG
jgi:hypothetical protein